MGATAFSGMSPMRGIHALLTFQSLGSFLVRQRRIMLVSSSGVPARNKWTSILDYLKTFAASMRHFGSDLDVTSSDVIEEVSLSVGEFGAFWVNSSFPLRGYFLALYLAWNDAIDHIFHASLMRKILTLNGFSIDFKPAVPLILFQLLGSVTCLGWTVICSISKSYCLTSEIAFDVRILMMRFSAPNSFNLVFK